MQFELEYYAEGVRYASVVQLNWNIRRRRSLCLGSAVELEYTPKAFANFSPRVGAKRQPWDPN